MAYASLSRRALSRQSLLALTITTMLSACSSGDLVPPNSIDSGTQVGAISPVRNLPREPLSQQPYPMNSAPVSQASTGYLGSTPNGPRNDAYAGDGGHYLRAPDQVEAAPLGAPSNTQQMASRQGRLPMIDSDEAMQAQGRQLPTMAAPQNRRQMANAGPATIPDEGINIDSELGFGPDESDVTGLAEEEDTDIAEGVGNQPVIDGIGTDNPRALTSRRPGAQPRYQPRYQPMAADDRVIVPPKRSGAGIQGDYANGGMNWNDGSRVVAPSRVPTNRGGMQEVAMIRPNNPAGPMGNGSMSDGPMSQRDDPWIRGAMPQSEIGCRAELRRLGVEFEDRPRIAPGGSCGIDYPVKLSGLSGNIDVKPAVTLNCQTTLAFAKWVKNELAPSARLRYLSGVQRITPLGGYSCRRMNNSSQRYNPMSEHAKGNAIDVGAITLKDGHDIDVRKKGFFSMREGALLKSVRSDSCKYFNTVLGPGSNAEHWNHFHFDLRSRRGGKRYCD